MDDIEIRPTVKFVRAGALSCGVIALAVWGAFAANAVPLWVAVAASLLPLWPLAVWARIRTNLTVLTGDRLRSESGVLSRSTRNLMLSRIQDVGLQQSLWNRLFNVGDIWIETAGASSRVFLHQIDAPQALVDKILERAKTAT